MDGIKSLDLQEIWHFGLFFFFVVSLSIPKLRKFLIIEAINTLRLLVPIMSRFDKENLISKIFSVRVVVLMMVFHWQVVYGTSQLIRAVGTTPGWRGASPSWSWTATSTCTSTTPPWTPWTSAPVAEAARRRRRLPSPKSRWSIGLPAPPHPARTVRHWARPPTGPPGTG